MSCRLLSRVSISVARTRGLPGLPPLARCLTTLHSGPASFRPRDQPLAGNRPLLSTPSIVDVLSQRRLERHWSENWEAEENTAKKRFSNEGFYFQSLFTRRTAEFIWKGVTSSSKAARRSGGRGKRGTRMRRSDLNRGQRIGAGKIPMTMPGLNARLSEPIRELPKDPDWESNLLEQRKFVSGTRRKRQHPLERGWTSAKLGGRRIGPPEPVGDQSFEDFETWILQFRRVCHMDGRVGRDFGYKTLVVVGNRKGLAGWATATSKFWEASQQRARRKAILRLQHVQLYNDHTVFHKTYSKFHASHVFLEPRPEGHGVRAHRVIETICKAFGIKDLWAKVEQSTTNYEAITRAFFSALRAQKDIQQLADEMRLYAVEYRPETDNFPVLLTAPRPEVGTVRRDEDIGTEEYRDLDLVLNSGEIFEFKPLRRPPFLDYHDGYRDIARWEYYKRRNQEAAELRRQVVFSDEYPEAYYAKYEDLTRGEMELD